MSIPLQPSSPSARQLRQPSPTSPSYAEHQYKRTLLDDVKLWTENKVTDWLCNQSLGRFSQKFIGDLKEKPKYISITNGQNCRTQHYRFSFT